MAKRFIDTEIFADEWFGDLSKDGKLFFIYFITCCDHAGILRLNNKLLEFQTGIRSSGNVVKELGDSLVTVKDNVYFMPKFIKFQYPKFPQSAVKQQESAIKILDSLGLWDDKTKTYQTLTKELSNSYVNDSVIVEDNKESEKNHAVFPSKISFSDLPDSNLKSMLEFAKVNYTVGKYEKDIYDNRPYAILWLLMKKRGSKEKGYELFKALSEEEKLSAYQKAKQYTDTEEQYIPHIERFIKNNDFSE